MFSLFPKNIEFGPKYQAATLNIQELAELFSGIPNDWKNLAESRKKSNAIEDAGDKIIRDIILSLNDSFITPFDREDMYILADRLDDIADAMNHVIEHLDIYRINKERPYMEKFAKLYLDAGHALEKVLKHLFDTNPEQESTEKILILLVMLSNQSSQVYEESLEQLFAKEKDPVLLIKWENLIREMHEIMTLFKKASRAVESIIMKVG